MANAARQPGGGLIVAPDTFTYVHRREIVARAARLRLPAIYPFRDFVEIGGLLSYGVDLLAPFEEAPACIDRILKGARPADLPVQNPIRPDHQCQDREGARSRAAADAPGARGRGDRIKRPCGLWPQADPNRRIIDVR
jgi:putative ABC transport system substrate-binding protein